MHEFWRRGEERERGRGDAGQKCEGSGKEKNGKGIGNGRWTLLLISVLGRIGRLVDLRFFFFFPSYEIAAEERPVHDECLSESSEGIQSGGGGGRTLLSLKFDPRARRE